MTFNLSEFINSKHKVGIYRRSKLSLHSIRIEVQSCDIISNRSWSTLLDTYLSNLNLKFINLSLKSILLLLALFELAS